LLSDFSEKDWASLVVMVNMEIERKFLVDHDKWKMVEKPEPKQIVQAYIMNTPEKRVTKDF